MTLNGTLVKETTIKSDGDAFLELFCYKPYEISDMCPPSIQSCDILDGKWGSLGSVIIWKYSHSKSSNLQASIDNIIIFKLLVKGKNTTGVCFRTNIEVFPLVL